MTTRFVSVTQNVFQANTAQQLSNIASFTITVDAFTTAQVLLVDQNGNFTLDAQAYSGGFGATISDVIPMTSSPVLMPSTPFYLSLVLQVFAPQARVWNTVDTRALQVITNPTYGGGGGGGGLVVASQSTLALGIAGAFAAGGVIYAAARQHRRGELPRRRKAAPPSTEEP